MLVTPSKTPRALQAQQKSAEARQIFESIRTDQKLSLEGRREALAREWWHRTKEIRNLEAAELAGKRDRRESLHRELFGNTGYMTGSDIISQRDAADRASRLESQEDAERLITAARRNGDTTLLKSIAEHAFQQGWTQALEHWADGHSGTEDKINELYRLTSTRSSTADIAELMAHGLAFDLEKPSEIVGLPNTAIADMVGESTTDYGSGAVAATNNGRSDRSSDYNVGLNSSALTSSLQGSLGGAS